MTIKHTWSCNTFLIGKNHTLNYKITSCKLQISAWCLQIKIERDRNSNYILSSAIFLLDFLEMDKSSDAANEYNFHLLVPLINSIILLVILFYHVFTNKT